MSRDIQFDVVIPAHNAAATVAEAVRSALRQSYPPQAVIVVADACDDDTAAVAKAAGARVIGIDARSVAVARNSGVAQGLSPWIAFLDADDLWYPGWLQAVAEQIDAHDDAALFYGQVLLREPRGELRQQPCLPAPPHQALPVLLTRSLISTSATVLARQVFLRLGGFSQNYSHGEDWDLWLRVAEQHALRFVPGWQVEYHLSALSAMRDPGSFMRARAQSLDICQRCLQRNNIENNLKNQALTYCLHMSAERFLAHGFVRQARRDLRAALVLSPKDLRLWSMAALSILRSDERALLLALRRRLRTRWQKLSFASPKTPKSV